MDESDSYSVLLKVGICSHTERFSQSVPEPEYQSLIAPIISESLSRRP